MCHFTLDVFINVNCSLNLEIGLVLFVKKLTYYVENKVLNGTH